MTVAQTSLLIVGIIIVILIAVPILAAVIRDRDYRRQIAGKKPMREFRMNCREIEETHSTENELLNRYELDMKAKQNTLHAGGISALFRFK